MKINPKEIIEGWKNHLFPKESLKELISTVSEERLAICKSCEFNSTPENISSFSGCKSCGCPLIPKSKCLSCHCPINKWEAVATDEEDTKIHESL